VVSLMCMAAPIAALSDRTSAVHPAIDLGLIR